MNKPLVSVIIPTYNREDVILRAVESVKNQTYKNIEIIIIDDCSSDNTYEVIKSELNSNIRYYKNEKNQGGAGSRNVGASKANGEIFAFLDSDDEWYDYKIEEQMKMFNDNIDLVYSGYVIINEQTKEETRFNNDGEITLKKILSNNCIGTTSSICIKKDRFLEIGGFDKSLTSCQDWDLYIRAFKDNNFSMVTKACVKYYYHNNSITGNYLNVINGHKKVFDKIEQLMNEKYQLKESDRRYVKSNNMERLGHAYMKFRKMNEGTKCFKDAIGFNKCNMTAWKNYILSILLKERYFKYKKLN